MKKMSLTINEKDIEVLAQKISGVLWFHYNGETYQYLPEVKGSQASKSGAQQDPSKITAPMPGKIIKIHKLKGDEVKEGETLIVMEAMKMEYNLKAVQDMKICRINCKELQIVSLGELLVEMEEPNV